MNIHVIGDEFTVRGLQLAGIEGTRVASQVEALAAALTQIEKGALLLITAEFEEGIRKELRRLPSSKREALIVTLPSPEEPEPGREVDALRQVVEQSMRG